MQCPTISQEVHLLSENPEISQTDVAERLKISQPAVSARINKLK